MSTSNFNTADAEFLASLPPSASTTPEPYSDVPNELKTLDNWVCFRHETKPNGEPQNAPYRVDGMGHAKSNDSSTWSPFADAMQASINPTRNFDGVSFMLLGTPYLGFDFDDVVHNEIPDPYVAAILQLMVDPYAELSYSGTGLRVFINCPGLPRPHPTQFKKSGHGVEIYHGEWAGKPLTITGRRYSGQEIPTITFPQFDLVYLLCSQILDEKFKALWLGDTIAYGGDDNRADEALCCRLARLLNFNPEKIDAAFRWSGLARDKWERKDYRDRTIDAAIRFEKSRDVQSANKQSSPDALVFHLPAALSPENREHVCAPALNETDGWFPKGEVSLIGAPSGASKTTWLYQMLLAQNCKAMFFGHATCGRSFHVMAVDRGKKAHAATMERMHLRVGTIPFSRLRLEWDVAAVQNIVNAFEELNPRPEILVIEGVDMLVSEVSSIKSVTAFMNALDQFAKHYDITVIGTLGSPKIKVGQGYVAKRDNLLGSSAWGRLCETIVNLQFPQSDDTDTRRLLFVLLRNAPAEKFTLGFNCGQLEVIPDIDESEVDGASEEIQWFQEQARLAKDDPTKKWWTVLDMERALTLAHSTACRHVADEHAKQHLLRKSGSKSGKGSAAQYRWNESKANPIWVAQKKQEAAEQDEAL